MCLRDSTLSQRPSEKLLASEAFLLPFTLEHFSGVFECDPQTGGASQHWTGLQVQALCAQG
eukprot:347632-Chlamydomonas_euryale.AAC.1